MIMTRDKAFKQAVRQRMAETGEPFTVARRATAEAGEAEPTGPLTRSAGPVADEAMPPGPPLAYVARESQTSMPSTSSASLTPPS